MDKLDIKNFPSERTVYTLPPGIKKIGDFNETLVYFLPNFVKVNFTHEDIRIKSKLKINQTLIFTKQSSFYTKLGFSQSHSYPLNDMDEFFQLIAGSYKSEKPINITGVNKVHLKCNCVDGSVVNGVRESISSHLV